MRAKRGLLLAALFLTAGLSARAADDPARPQWRAFWVDAFNAGIRTPAEVDRLVADLKSLNCNAVIAQVRKRGDAYFRKAVEPFTEDPMVPVGFDPLADLLAKAHREDIQVHAWINAMPVWRAQGAMPQSPEHVLNAHGPTKTGRDTWLTCNEKGEFKFPVGYFLDPGHPQVSEHLARVVADLARNYDVDGVHLDFIRYPETEADSDATGYGVGYNPVSVERFNQVAGKSGVPARKDPDWCAWRRQQVTQVVRRLRVALLDANPKVLLSAALIPWGDGPRDEAGWVVTAPYNRVFQDWHDWRREGLLDLAIPMNYSRAFRPDHAEFFKNWTTFERAHKYRSRLTVGLGAYLNSLADTEKQLRLVLEPADGLPEADGVCFFSYASFRSARPESGRPSIEMLRQSLTLKSLDGKAPAFAKPAARPNLPRLLRPVEGTIAGFARDAAGKGLDSVDINLKPLAGGGGFRARTDGNGFFAAVFVPPGRYQVAAPSGASAEVEVAPGRVSWVKPAAGVSP